VLVLWPQPAECEGQDGVSAWVKARIWAIGAMVATILAVVAVLVVAWIMGDAQPTRWIETPVAPAAQASTMDAGKGQ
jgi:hypothetical protein